MSAPAATLIDGSASRDHSFDATHASSAAVGQFRYFRLESSGRDRGDQMRSMIESTSTKGNRVDVLKAARNDSGSARSVSGGAMAAS